MAAGNASDEGVRKEAGHWLELKEAWAKLTPASKSLGLGPEADGYFQGLTFRYFSKVLGSDGVLVRLRLPSPPAQEAWGIMFRELYVRRTSTGRRVFDDIFLRAFESARAAGCGDSAAALLGFVKKQYEMRLRDVVRSWAREQLGSLGDRTTESLDHAPKGDSHDERSGHDVIPDDSRDEDDPEWRDLQQCGQRIAGVMFGEMDSMLRTCILLHVLHVSLAHPLVVATLGKGKSVLFDHERRVRAEVVARCRAYDPGLDQEGQMCLATASYCNLHARCENWFFSEMRASPLFPLVMQRIPATANPQHGAIS
jgi:hypothetical protein